MAPLTEDKELAEKKDGSVDQIESMDGRSQEDKDAEMFSKSELDEKALLRKVSCSPRWRTDERADVPARSTCV